MTALTVGIATRNRQASLRRCVASLRLLGPAVTHVVVFDDRSDPPVTLEGLGEAAAGLPLQIVRGSGHIGGRDRMVREAPTECVLLLDDDAVVLDAQGIFEGCRAMDTDPSLGAVAFAQGEGDGRRWPEAMQPARASGPVLIPAYIGFAHLVRRSSFVAGGGYRASLDYYGEEKDFCIRLMDAGFHVLYLPHALVGHVPDPAGRDTSRFVRHLVRNDCLTSLYSDPLPYALASVPLRFWRYTRMVREMPGRDAGGLRWILQSLVRELPAVVRGRRAVSYKTMRRWRRLTRRPEPYQAPVRGAAT
ncbi:MAG TPA: glycosyltransferase [Vicinamibacterales bacterium]|nr:glycosyltransferase [Vicinamibacterales bacterium]